MKKNNQIPMGSVDYYGKEVILRDYVLNKIENIYKKYGLESLYTPIFEHAEVFNGHHGEGEKLLFRLKDRAGEEYVLKYDSTVPLARVISMHKDIKLPYKRYQLQQSYRDDEIDKGHYREFIQCDGDVVGSNSLVTDSEFVLMAYEGLRTLGFQEFTIRLNHRKLIKAIAEKANVLDKEGLLSIQRTIDIADKINKGSIEDVRAELLKTDIAHNVIGIIVDLISITNKSKDLNEMFYLLEKYFSTSQVGIEGINDLKEIVSYLPKDVLEKVKIDFTLARGADYYTGFILEAVINGISLGAVLGGGRYDNLVQAFSDENVPAVGMAFGLERIIVAMKELGLDKTVINLSEKKILVYAENMLRMQAINVASLLRKKYAVSLIFQDDLSYEELKEYCEVANISLVAKVDAEGNYKLFSYDNLDELKKELGVSRKLVNNN